MSTPREIRHLMDQAEHEFYNRPMKEPLWTEAEWIAINLAHSYSLNAYCQLTNGPEEARDRQLLEEALIQDLNS